MGCDIHFYVEQKIDGIWQRVSDDKGPKDPYYMKDKDGKEIFNKNCWKLVRYYNLFSTLADVRNIGKPGETNYITPIKQPTRCLPNDVSEEIKQEFESGLGGDWHTPTFYSLTELLAAKDKSFCYKTYVNIPNYRKFKKDKSLDWILTVNNWKSGIKLISNDKMERILGMAALLNEYEYITEISTQIKYGDMRSHFWEKIVPAMQALDANTDNIRCIMWFDN